MKEKVMEGPFEKWLYEYIFFQRKLLSQVLCIFI